MAKIQEDRSLFTFFTGLFVACLIISTVASIKIFDIWGIYLAGGTLVFPIIFILNDVLTEVYGYRKAKRVIITALVCQALAGIVFLIVGMLPSAPFWQNQAAYDTILGFVPRIALAGVLAFYFGSISNSIVISKMKYREFKQKHDEKRLSWRFVASTLVGELVDSVIFYTVAFGGVIPPGALIRTILTGYVIKVAYEIVILPLSTRVSEYLKKREGSAIDEPSTNYNPFSLSW